MGNGDDALIYSQERIHSASSKLTWGPIDPALAGIFELNLLTEGDLVQEATIQTGFLHKGLEKTLERRNWFTSTVAVDRVHPEASFSSELAFCMAVEEICNIQIPRRAQVIRLVLCELERISSHLSFLARLAIACGFETVS